MSLGGDMVVNSTADDNVSDLGLTLREAMLMARGGTGASGINRALSGPEASVMINASADGSTSSLIHFNPGFFPPGTPASILLGSDLPDLSATSDVVSGIGAGVIVDGNGFATTCFTVSGGGNVIEGLTIRNCQVGVAILGASNVVGGSLIPAQRNVINTHSFVGVVPVAAGATGNTLEGNYIGTNAAGTAALPNGTGVRIEQAGQDNTIGGSSAAERNVISGNDYGVVISGAGTTGNTVKGNYIGTNAAGTAIIPDTARGVVIAGGAQNNTIGGSSAAERNVISGNGIRRGTSSDAGTSGNTVKGNYIGTNAAGTAAVANGYGAWSSEAGAQNNTIGGSSAGERNVISGNNVAGVLISGTGTNGNTVKGNYIGTNAAGTAALPNNTGVLHGARRPEQHHRRHGRRRGQPHRLQHQRRRAGERHRHHRQHHPRQLHPLQRRQGHRQRPAATPSWRLPSSPASAR